MRRFLVVALTVPFLVLPAASAASAACGRVANDFNGDGYGDLAVGAPHRADPIGNVPNQGAVSVAYGSATGLTPSATFTGRSDGLPSTTFRGSARLGEALAAGYFDGDCYADLAVSAASISTMLILYGSQTGLTTARSAAFDRAAVQPGGAADSGMSWDLTAGDFNGDGFDDVAAGAPWASNNGGAFGVVFGSSGGITTSGAQWITQDSPDVPGAVEPGDTFGRVLAAGDFNGDGRADLAAAAPGEALGTRTDAGGVIVFPGTATGLATTGSKWWDQDVAGVPGAAEQGDGFGAALAAGDTNADGRADLMVGIPAESIGAKAAAGMVSVFRGSASGLVAGAAFDQDNTSIPGAAEPGDNFGGSLALVDLNRDGKRDLAIGVHAESVGTVQATGAVNILYSTTTGPAAAGAGYIDQNSAGVPGANETLDAFGWELSRLANAYGGDALVVNAYDEMVTLPREGAVTVLPSAPRGATRPAGHFFSGVNFPGGPAAEANFGGGLA